MLLQIEWINASTLTEVVLLALAFLLSSVVGIERHRQVKSAGLRTHTLVGVGSAIFTLVSAYGFSMVDGANVTLDPSRIAAQIVSGIGFLGAGVIFVRQNIVSGLTTAASVWVVAAIGMACGAGMPILAVAGTALHLVTVTVLSRLARRVPIAGRGRDLVVYYKDGRGALRSVLERASEMGFEVALTGTHREESGRSTPIVAASLRFNRGKTSIDNLVEALTEVKGVQKVEAATEGDAV
ncbi:MgtC/SapB family protein [Microbacterium sp. 18062]|uniref:MgtC/SapB family protein n=1 Tax=Microbacterium sp. 18062 TaxID=2681410 RepID=UPI0013587ADC|nr:MgtC/SapB family protein [Microbacterium sp. 18062]